MAVYNPTRLSKQVKQFGVKQMVFVIFYYLTCWPLDHGDYHCLFGWGHDHQSETRRSQNLHAQNQS